MSKHRIAVVIPARWASTRFPGKPLHQLAGKPLVQHVWERASRAKGIDTVIVATDDMRIAECAFDFGAEVALTSPKCVSGTDRCAEVAKRLESIETVINVQGDEPFIDPKLISQLGRDLAKHPEADMITAATPFQPGDDPEAMDVVKVVLNRASEALYFSRSLIPRVRDGSPFPHLRHLGIYGYRTSFLLQFVRWKPGTLELAESLEQLRALENGAKIRVVLTDHRSIGVDTPEDARKAEALLRPTKQTSRKRQA
jgi:3-deoxy-manno-octulosonate cytidylyltransferase (CMP-KDO synthetase)